jgi:hypothetical protein
MPLNAVRHIRKMRGGAQSHLLQADDGHYYVVKFRNNPQHRRVLVNELIAWEFLDYLKIAAPRAEVIQVSPEFLAANPDVYLTVGARRVAVETGRHFGSLFPGDPLTLAVYDFLPDALLAQICNLSDFRAILVFDRWIGNGDGRQSIFYRARVSDPFTRQGRPGFVASMIDHGFAFNGPNWDFPESPLYGLYARPLVYRDVRSLDDFQPWLDLAMNFPEEVVDRALKGVPREWIDGDEEELERVLEELLRRRSRLPELIASAREGRSNPFPNWTGTR